MNSHYTYFLILAGSLAGPLLLSFDRKVAYYRQWKFVFPAILPPALFFIVWDELKTRSGVWHFNPEYITGIKLGSLPLEELLFFIIVPYCCVFIYECVCAYFPTVKHRSWGNWLMRFLFVLFAVAAVVSYGKAYTFYTSLFNFLFIGLLLVRSRWFPGFDASSFFVSYAVSLIPFLVVNGLLTGIPVVLYNDAENIGIRIIAGMPWPLHNIPFEDMFYGMLLILMNIVLLERYRNKDRMVEN